MRLSMRAETYTPVVLPGGKKKTPTTLLVRNGAQEVADTVATWLTKENIDEAVLEDWAARGLAFSLSPQGTQAIYDKEAKQQGEKQRKERFGTSSKFTSPTMYVKSADGSVYVKTSEMSALNQVVTSLKGEEGAAVGMSLLRDGDGANVDSLIRRGVVFTNVSKLFIDEQMVTRADSIATRLQNEFPIDSPEWKRWTERTTLYNATSLTQVMATYFQENSIGDVGGPNANYVPKRGYPGTLAPGEKFTDNYALEDLPRRILHPWPAMQQIQFHVRYPPNHPMLPPPLLWFGLNNMYTDNFTEWQLNTPTDEIVGGASMDPKDAVRIAKYATFGMSYDPADQIEHGGMIFNGGHEINFYNPDHGPTISEERAKPSIPPHLLPVTERWLDPLHGLDVPTLRDSPSPDELEDDLFEQEVRRYAAEKLISSLPKQLSEDPEQLTNLESNKRRVEDNISQLLILRNDALDNTPEWHEEEERAPMDPLVLAEKLSVPSKERDLAKQITDSMFGK